MHSTNPDAGDGRFQPGQSGNPSGRPRGARNKMTVRVEEVLDERAADFVNQLIDQAAHGSLPALRMCVDRVFPRRQGRPITFALPRLRSLDDVAEAAGDIVEGVASGELTPNEAVDLFRVIDAYRRTLFGVDLAKKVAQLERRLAAHEIPRPGPVDAAEPAGDAPAPATAEGTREEQADTGEVDAASEPAIARQDGAEPPVEAPAADAGETPPRGDHAPEGSDFRPGPDHANGKNTGEYRTAPR